jgi:hypothetical protein
MAGPSFAFRAMADEKNLFLGFEADEFYADCQADAEAA